MKKRMLAWLLVLVIALGMVPVPAMAQEYAPTDGTAIDRVYQTEGDTEPPGPIDGALTTFSLTPAEPAQADGVYQIGSKEELAWLAQEVNEGRGGATVSMHPDVAVKEIKEGAKRAIKNAKHCLVPMPDFFEMTVRFREHPTAYSKSFYPGAVLEDEKNVCFSSDDWFEMLRFCHFVLSD